MPQQLGTPWALPVLALLGILTHRPRLAVSAACAVPLEKLLEAALKRGFARQRPAREDSDTVLHDDAPADGGSFPSGHAALTMVAALLIAPSLPGWAGIAITVVAGAVGVIRVRQGAHFPLDVVGGALLGTSVACALRATVAASSRALAASLATER